MPDRRKRAVSVIELLEKLNDHGQEVLAKTHIGGKHQFCVRGVVCIARHVKNGVLKTIEVSFDSNTHRFYWNQRKRKWYE